MKVIVTSGFCLFWGPMQHLGGNRFKTDNSSEMMAEGTGSSFYWQRRENSFHDMRSEWLEQQKNIITWAQGKGRFPLFDTLATWFQRFCGGGRGYLLKSNELMMVQLIFMLVEIFNGFNTSIHKLLSFSWPNPWHTC